jgi:hypothetical protein
MAEKLIQRVQVIGTKVKESKSFEIEKKRKKELRQGHFFNCMKSSKVSRSNFFISSFRIY